MRVAVNLVHSIGEYTMKRVADAIKGMFGEDVILHLSDGSGSLLLASHFDKVNFFTSLHTQSDFESNVRVVDRRDCTVNDPMIIGLCGDGVFNNPLSMTQILRNQAAMVLGDSKIPQVDAVVYFNDDMFEFPSVSWARKSGIKVVRLVEDPKKEKVK